MGKGSNGERAGQRVRFECPCHGSFFSKPPLTIKFLFFSCSSASVVLGFRQRTLVPHAFVAVASELQSAWRILLHAYLKIENESKYYAWKPCSQTNI